MAEPSRRKIVGWIAVSLSTAITCFWALWGILENFHEGWYYESILSNLGLMLVQYLSPMLLFMGVTLVSIYWPRLGGGLHLMLAVLLAWFFDAFTNPVMLLLIAPLVGLGALYWFGQPHPRRIATILVVSLPVLTLILVGIAPALRVSQRLDDGILQARLVRGNEVELIWAPDGPGWPSEGTNWEDASRICEYLIEDGVSLAPTPQDIWRLPTVSEAVRSMTRHSKNSGGVWDDLEVEARYDTTPDKESPLWNVHSQVIYWWTATEVDEDYAFIIVYDGKVWSRSKEFGPDYLGFRCVKQP